MYNGFLNSQHLMAVYYYYLKCKKTQPSRTRLGLKNGGDLLSRKPSTIGASVLNFSVRNGKR